MVKLNQIRAARALLGWHQKELARLANVSELSVINIENGKTSPQKSTLDKIIAAFEVAGVSFTSHGIEEKDSSFTILSGPNWYVRLLEDVEKTYHVHAGTSSDPMEWILFYSDDKHSPPAVIKKVEELLGLNIKLRHFVKEGNLYLQHNLEKYRYVPAKFFDDARLIMCYGNKVCINEQKDDASDVYIFRNQELAKFLTRIADMMWEFLPQPTKTSVPKKDRYSA